MKNKVATNIKARTVHVVALSDYYTRTRFLSHYTKPYPILRHSVGITVWRQCIFNENGRTTCRTLIATSSHIKQRILCKKEVGTDIINNTYETKIFNIILRHCSHRVWCDANVAISLPGTVTLQNECCL